MTGEQNDSPEKRAIGLMMVRCLRDIDNSDLMYAEAVAQMQRAERMKASAEHELQTWDNIARAASLTITVVHDGRGKNKEKTFGYGV